MGCSGRTQTVIAEPEQMAPLRAELLDWHINPIPLQSGFGELVDPQGQLILRGTIDQLQRIRLELLKESFGTGRLNLPAPTMGGKQFWKDVVVQQDWRIQFNVLTESYRLLDPNNIRRAWGGLEGCQVAFEQWRLDLRLRPQSAHAVVLLHGMIRSRSSLNFIKNALKNEGYEVIAIDYASTRESQAEIAQQVAQVLADQPAIQRFSFVTHSMGGLIFRRLMAQAASQRQESKSGWWDHIQAYRAVMLFPPNQGAHMANIRADWLVYDWIMGVAGQELTTEAVSRLPPVAPIPTAVLAGGRGHDLGRSTKIPGDDDGTVAVTETYLEGVQEWRRFNVGHTFGMNDPDIIQATVLFINDGSLPPALGANLLR